jgi:HlyD family secretion protein
MNVHSFYRTYPKNVAKNLQDLWKFMKPDIDISKLAFQKNANSEDINLQSSLPKRNKLTRIIIPSLLLGGFLVVCLWAARGFLIPAIDVTVTPVIASNNLITSKEKSGAPLFQAPGWIEPEPLPIQISALTSGVISEVIALDGNIVKRDQVVAKLINKDANLLLAQASANLEQRRAEYTAAEKGWQNPIDQQEAVSRNQAEQRRLSAEHFELTQKLLLAGKLLENKRRMAEIGAVSVNQQRLAEAEVIELEAQIAKLEAQQAASQASTEAAESRLKLRLADRERLDVARATLKEAEIKLEQAHLQLDRCQIRSPIDGVVMRVMVTPGMPVTSVNEMEGIGTPIMIIYSPEHLQARVDVPMAEAARIQVGMPAEVRIEAIVDRTFHAQVIRIAGQADLQRNTLPVKVRLLDIDPTIKPDMIARVQFFSAELSKDSPTTNQSVAALFVTEETIENKDGQTAVWILDANTGQAKRRVVSLGSRRQGELREVTSGLAIGEKVIRQNRERLSEGVKVRIRGIQ